MMFATKAGGHPVTTLDWQSFAYGNGATDVAYFLSGALSPEAAARERGGAAGPLPRGPDGAGRPGLQPRRPGPRLWPGRLPAVHDSLLRAMVVKQTARGDDMFMQMIGGASQQILDHDAVATLG
jgi:hypothetical protein